MPHKPHGLARNTADYGDRDFALYLRRSFAKSMGYSRTMLDRPVVGTVNTEVDPLDGTTLTHCLATSASGSGSSFPQV